MLRSSRSVAKPRFRHAAYWLALTLGNLYDVQPPPLPRLYRESGWSRFDETAPPYSAAEIATERNRYEESRTFEKRADRDLTIDDGVTTPADRPIDPVIRPL